MEGLRLQIFSVLTISLAFINIGTVLQFTSLIRSYMSRNNSTIFGSHISMNDDQSDMMGSFIGMGAFFGAVLLPFIGSLLRRKGLLAILGLVATASWLGIAFSLTISSILVFRFISGVEVGICSVFGGTYIVEVVDSNVRGMFCCFLGVAIVTGLALSATMSYFMSYYSAAILNSCICGLFLIGLIFVPESPGYLVTKGKDVEALDVLHKLRSNKKDTIEKELDLYRNMNVESQDKSIWKGLIQPKILKNMAVIFAISFVRGFGGFDILTANAFRILKSLGSSIDENLATLIIFASQLPSSLIFSFCLIDRLGRKKCLYLSCAIVSLAQFCLAGYSFANEHVDRRYQTLELSSLNLTEVSFGGLSEGWTSYLPVLLLATSLAGFYFGLQSIPYLLMAEYFPTWIRPQAGSICSSLACILQFSSLQVYTPVISMVDHFGLFLVTGIVSSLGIPATFFLVRETMGKDIG